MKRALAAAALAAPLALVPGIAAATGGTTTPTNSVSINAYADYGLIGTNLDVGLQVKCTGGLGVVTVTVNQPYPETPNPLGAQAFGTQDVVCDGRSRAVAVTVVCDLCDAGKAKATAAVMNTSAKAARTITIIAH